MKKLTISGTKGVITDNEEFYLQFLNALKEHQDPEAIASVIKKECSIEVLVSPSDPKFKQSLIDNLLNGHRLLGLKIIYSKSLSKMKAIQYSLKTCE